MSERPSCALKKRCCFPCSRGFPSFLCAQLDTIFLNADHSHAGSPGNDRPRFVLMAQIEVDGGTVARTDIHTHHFNRIRLIKPFKKLDHFVLSSPFAHLNHLTGLYIAENAVIAMPFSSRKLIDAHTARSGRLRCFTHASPCFGKSVSHSRLKAFLNETSPRLCWLDHMGDGLATCLLCKSLAKSLSGAFVSATHAIGFGKRSSASLLIPQF